MFSDEQWVQVHRVLLEWRGKRMDHELFWTASLRISPWGATMTRVLAAALGAVAPGVAIRRMMRREGGTFSVGTDVYDLRRYRRVFVVGAGKAGAPMTRAVMEMLGDKVAGGVVLVKDGYGEIGSQEGDRSGVHPVAVVEAGHPIPDQRGVAGAQRMWDLLEGLSEQDVVLALISGGGSALMTLPVDGVHFVEVQSLTLALLGCGARIEEINTVRKHLDRLKGGGLARLVYPARLITLVLSDVVGNPLEVIASGPTVADPSTYADAYAILQRYALVDRVAPSVVAHLREGCAHRRPETPKPGEVCFTGVANYVIASNREAAEGALAAAQAEGLHTLLLTTYLQGEAREVGQVLAAIGREVVATGRPIARPACVVAGGETTVTLRGAGRGGRNQEMALAAVADLAGLDDVVFVTLATDGGDGPTDAAGAVVTGETLARAHQCGYVPSVALANNNAYDFFARLDDLLRPGPTATNVNDLAFLFVF